MHSTLPYTQTYAPREAQQPGFRTVEAVVEDLAEELRVVLRTLDTLHVKITHLEATPYDDSGAASSVFQLLTLIAERVNSNHADPHSLRASVEEWVSVMRIAARRANPELRGKGRA
jgi:hypothetical protein